LRADHEGLVPLRLIPNMKLMLDCRALAKLLSQSQDRSPALAIQARMRLHLMTCQACRNVDEQMRFVRRAMQAVRVNPPTDLPAAKENR
jgi:predicted anti-sigma-YlaC factor YlaD